jgi:hypothetical protein
VIRLLILVKTLKSITLHYISLRTPLKEYVLNYNLLLRQLYNYINRYRYFTLKLMPINTPTNISMANTRLIKHTKNTDKAKDKALE